jgi:hypothetical protein
MSLLYSLTNGANLQDFVTHVSDDFDSNQSTKQYNYRMIAESERATILGLDEAVALPPAFTRRLTGVTIADVVRLMAVSLFGVFAFDTRLRDRDGSSALNLPCVMLSPIIDKWSKIIFAFSFTIMHEMNQIANSSAPSEYQLLVWDNTDFILKYSLEVEINTT